MYTFRHDVADCPECEDDSYVLLKDGVDTHFAIQDCHSYGGGYGINQYFYKDGQLESMTIRGTARSLKKAKEACIFFAQEAGK